MDEFESLIDGYRPIFWVAPKKEHFGLTAEGAMLQDLAQEYAVCADPNANAGLIVYGKYNDNWRPNPWSTRFLIRILLEKIGITIVDGQVNVRPIPNTTIIPAYGDRKQYVIYWDMVPSNMNWATVNKDGYLSFHSEKPFTSKDTELAVPLDMYASAGHYIGMDYIAEDCPDWEQLVFERPTAQPTE